MRGEDVLRQRIAIINRAGNRLADLVKPEFPKTISRSAPPHRLALHGLVARATGTMEAILHLTELRREADLANLLRSLYDHTTILGWLAADPDANYPLWKAEDARERVRAHRAWQRDLGAELLISQKLAMFERVAAEQHPGPTDLLARARAADQHWQRRLGITDDKTTFVGLYQIVFRSSSSRVHSTLQGLNDVTVDAPDHVIVMLESTDGNQALAGNAVVIYALALRISATTNGFPRAEQIDAALAEYNAKRWADGSA